MRYRSLFIICILVFASCIPRKDLYQGGEESKNKPQSNEKIIIKGDSYDYIYPFGQEATNIKAEITISTKEPIDENKKMTAEIATLKYNKSWVCMLTQDDCVMSSLCRTWAAINGKPVADSTPYPTPNVDDASKTQSLFYHYLQLQYDDLTPATINLGKTLGSTDGTGNEIRFHCTTTLVAESQDMSDNVNISPGFNQHFSRFYRKTLQWSSVAELLNYGWGIAFHDLNITNKSDPNAIYSNYPEAQNAILSHLKGRGCKMLSQPDNNTNYVKAAQNYAPIQTITAQQNATDIYPFKINDSMDKKVFYRTFNDANMLKTQIEEMLQLPKEERRIINIGVHNTDNDWVYFLKWINDTYGKDGDDSVWFPSQEEYYEYNFYRINGTIKVEKINDHTFKLIVSLPSKIYFYFPSVTINLNGILKDQVETISTDEAVKGLSYNNHNNGIMINIDCRKFLAEHATHYVSVYEQCKSNMYKKADAIYFTNMLKESDKKDELLKRIN